METTETEVIFSERSGKQQKFDKRLIAMDSERTVEETVDFVIDDESAEVTL